jgi:hypothetical protein
MCRVRNGATEKDNLNNSHALDLQVERFLLMHVNLEKGQVPVPLILCLLKAFMGQNESNKQMQSKCKVGKEVVLLVFE